MIEINDGRLIHLKGRNTSYILRVTETGHLEHIYYGRRLEHVEKSEKAIVEKNLTRALPSIAIDSNHPTMDLNNMPLEASFEGKGDFREPLIRIRGKKTLDLRYQGERAYPGIRRYKKAHLPIAVAEESAAETLEILLEAGADINATDKWGNTLLHYIAASSTSGSKEAAALVMDFGTPDVNDVNNEGLTALDIAANKNDESLVKFLLKYS